MKKRSYSGLQADLRCARDEAQGYLDEVVRLREEVKKLNKVEDDTRWLRWAIGILLKALSDALRL